MDELIAKLDARLSAERDAHDADQGRDRERAKLILLLSEAAAALEAAREDAERLAFLAREPVIEGFIGIKKDIYDYASDCADEVGRDEFNDEDMLNGMRRLIDAAIDQARGKGGP